MPTHFLDWIASLNGGEPHRRMALVNLIYDAQNGRVRRTLMCGLVGYVEREWSKRSNKSAPDEIIRDFANSNPQKHYCQGRPVPVKAPKLGCSRVLDAMTLFEKNLTIPTAGCIIDNDIDTEEIQRLERRGLRDLTKSYMQTRVPFAWVTKSDQIDHLRQQENEPTAFATSVRDHLALTSYAKGDLKLVEVRYPPEVVSTMEMAPPTVMEGAGGAFRSLKRKDGWGRTVHLKTRKRALPEAVHRAVPFTGEFKLRFVGRPEPIDLSIRCKRCSLPKIQQLLSLLNEENSE